MSDTIATRLGVLGALNIVLVVLLPLLAGSKHQPLYPGALACGAVGVAMIVTAIGAWPKAPSLGVRVAVGGYCAMPILVCWVVTREILRMMDT